MKLKRLCKVILSAALAASCVFGLTGCGSEPGGNISNTMVFSEGDKIAIIVIEDYGTIRAKLFPDIAPVGVENFELLAKQGYYNGLKIHSVAKDAYIQGGSLYGDGTGGTALAGNSDTFPIEISPDARNFYGALGYANENGQNTAQFYIVSSRKTTDIKQYDPAKMREEATKYTAQLEGLEDTDPNFETYTAMEAYYTNLADMIEKADDAIVEKYNTIGGYPLGDGGYTIFGQVFEGLDVVDAIAKAEVTTDKHGQQCRPVKDIIISSVEVIEYIPPQEETGEGEGENNE